MLLLVGVALFFALIAWAVIGVAEARAGVKRLNLELGFEYGRFEFEPESTERGGVPQESSREAQVSGQGVRVSSIAA